jgi:hypothetical protein
MVALAQGRRPAVGSAKAGSLAGMPLRGQFAPTVDVIDETRGIWAYVSSP